MLLLCLQPPPHPPEACWLGRTAAREQGRTPGGGGGGGGEERTSWEGQRIPERSGERGWDVPRGS